MALLLRWVPCSRHTEPLKPPTWLTQLSSQEPRLRAGGWHAAAALYRAGGTTSGPASSFVRRDLCREDLYSIPGRRPAGALPCPPPHRAHCPEQHKSLHPGPRREPKCSLNTSKGQWVAAGGHVLQHLFLKNKSERVWREVNIEERRRARALSSETLSLARPAWLSG